MIIYLAGFKTIEKYYNKPSDDIYLLSSFWEHQNSKFGEYVLQERHILDSGAYSAINDKTGKYKNFDWDNYCKKYIAFIKQTNQKTFFELDIDCVVGLEKVEYYRKQIEDAIGIAPIPVWHHNRKADYFHYMCENYPYVAIGTTPVSVEGKIMRKNPELMNNFITIAKKNKSKIHGLGYTSVPGLKKYKFDSVDSTTWINGGKFALIVQFNRGELIVHKPQKNQRGINAKERLMNNFIEWVKFQKYAEANL